MPSSIFAPVCSRSSGKACCLSLNNFRCTLLGELYKCPLMMWHFLLTLEVHSWCGSLIKLQIFSNMPTFFFLMKRLFLWMVLCLHLWKRNPISIYFSLRDCWYASWFFRVRDLRPRVCDILIQGEELQVLCFWHSSLGLGVLGPGFVTLFIRVRPVFVQTIWCYPFIHSHLIFHKKV